MTLSKYELVLLRNSGQIEQVDKILTFLTTFLPGQTPSMELAGEAVVSSTAILQTYKSYVLNKVLEDSKKDLSARYMDAEYKANKNYKILAYILSIMKSTELFVEMTSAHLKGEKGRWRAVLSIEALKSALRLAMLGISRRALPSAVPVHDVTVESEELQKLLLAKEPTNRSQPGMTRAAYSGTNGHQADTSTKLPLTVGALQLQSPDIDRLRPPIQLIRRMTHQKALSEVLYILRPLLYAILLYRFRSRKRSWTPWLVGVALEIVARDIAHRDLYRHRLKRPSNLEKEAYQSKGSDMLWWLMRGAMYEQYSRAFVMGMADRLIKWPVLSLGGRLLQDAMYLFDEYYFASATM